MATGRPRKKIDKDAVMAMARAGLTVAEIAAYLGCSKDTLERRFMKMIEEGRQVRNASLRKKQHDLAMKGNVTMLVWLGKQYLGQTDKNALHVEGDMGLEIRDVKQKLFDKLTS